MVETPEPVVECHGIIYLEVAKASYVSYMSPFLEHDFRNV